jgi:glycosyltransferase involved in cell wall biosynthesis
LKIAFIHNYYIHYRVPIFRLFSENYSVTFFFNAIQSYVEKVSSKINYVIPFNLKTGNLSIPVLLPFHLIKKRFDIFISGDSANISTVETYCISRILRKPFVLWEERWFIKDRISTLMWPFIRYISSHASALIVPGVKSREFFVRIGVPKSRIFIAPNASYLKISTSHEEEIEETRRKLGLTDKTVILYFGRVTRIKGVSTLLKAFKQLSSKRKDVYLVVAGDVDPIYKTELDGLCKHLNTSDFKITGHLSMKDREIYFELADVVVVPSVTEVWGLAINEALVAGKPVISTNTTGASYDLIQNHVNGFIIPSENVHALLCSLKRLVENPNLMREFGKNSRKIAEQGYTYNHMMLGFKQAVESVL